MKATRKILLAVLALMLALTVFSVASAETDIDCPWDCGAHAGDEPGAHEEVLPADCISPERTAQWCDNCDNHQEVNFTGDRNPENHRQLTQTVVKADTCTEKGSIEYSCAACKTTWTEEVDAIKGHTFGDWKVTTPATCTTAGEQQRTCETCGAVEKQEIKATGHADKNDCILEVSTDATCETAGEKVYRCPKCNEIAYTEAIPATGHMWSEWETTKEATCVTLPQQERKCANCNKTETRDEPNGQLKKHDFPKNEDGSWKIEEKRVEATCVQAGSVTKSNYCTVCGAMNPDAPSSTEVLPKRVHDWSIYLLKDKDGNVVDGIQPDDAKLTDTTAYNPKHKDNNGNDVYDVTVTVTQPSHSATALVDGKVSIVCNICKGVEGAEYKHEEVIKATDERLAELGHGLHTADWEPQVEATCEHGGSVKMKCDDPDCPYARVDTTPIRTHDDPGIWDYFFLQDGKEYDPDVSWAGFKFCQPYVEIVRCHYCDKELDRYDGDVSEHSYVANGDMENFRNWAYREAPTCTEDGIAYWKCEWCGKDTSLIIPKTGHNTANKVTVVTKAPTCTEDGTVDYKCPTCNEIIGHGTSAKLGHIKDTNAGAKIEIKAATCTSDGYYREYCPRCKQYHDVVTFEARHQAPATLNDAQIIKTAGDKSIRVGWKSDFEYDEKQGYSFVKPTCTTAGSVTYKCGICSKSVTETIDPLKHKYTAPAEVKAATCTTDGYEAKRCDNCHQLADPTDTKNYKVIPATGHSKLNPNDPDAKYIGIYTCDPNDPSVVDGKCTLKYNCTNPNCGASVTVEVPLKKHSYALTEIFDKKTDEFLGYHMICQKCGATEDAIATAPDYAVDMSKVTKTGNRVTGTAQIKVTFGDADKVGFATPYARITYSYTLSNGDPFSYVEMCEMLPEMDDTKPNTYVFSYKVASGFLPATAKLDSVTVHAVADQNADGETFFDSFAYGNM